MFHPRARPFACTFLAVSLFAPLTVHAGSSTVRQFTSVRFGYTLDLAPGWAVSRGDCATYAVVGSGHPANTMEIHVTKGALSASALRKAEVKLLHASGTWTGAASYSTLHLGPAIYQTGQAMARSKQGSAGVLAAGITRNNYTYILVNTVHDPAGSAGKQAAGTEQAMLGSLTFVKPAAIGTFTCIGTGISRPAAVQPKASATPSSTATGTPITSSSVTSTPVPTATLTPVPATLPGGVPTSGSTANGCPITALQASGETYVLGLLNADRTASNVQPLTLSNVLSVPARNHSCDMGTHDNLSHTGSDGSDPSQRIQSAGVTYSTAGENVGMSAGQGFLPSLAGIDQAMMAEPPAVGTHHWNIINPAFHQVGIGVIIVGRAVWVTEDFVG